MTYCTSVDLLADSLFWCDPGGWHCRRYVHWFDSNAMFAGFTDIRGIRSETGGRTWSFDYTGHSLNTMYALCPLAVGVSFSDSAWYVYGLNNHAAGRYHMHTSSNGITYAATSSTHDLFQDTHVSPQSCDTGDGRVISQCSTRVGSSYLFHHQSLSSACH